MKNRYRYDMPSFDLFIKPNFNYLVKCVTFHETETRTFGNRKKTRFLITNWSLNYGFLNLKKQKKMKRAKLIETKRIEWLIYSKILTGCWSACGLTELFRSEKICRFATATVNIAFTFIWSGVEGPRWNKSHASTTSALTIVRWQIANVTHRLNSVCEVINKLVNI
jgi:hypothetical protein